MSAMSELHLARQEWAAMLIAKMGKPATIIESDDPCTWILEFSDGRTVTRTVGADNITRTITSNPIKKP